MKTRLMLIALTAVAAVATLLWLTRADVVPEIHFSTHEFRSTPLPNSNPYAIFGSEPVMLTTEHERTLNHKLEITNVDRSAKLSRMELNTQTGAVEVFDKQGKFVAKTLLNSRESARWLTQDPHARKYAPLSPYSYAANNPIMFVDPDGKDIWVFDSLGNVRAHIKTTAFDAFLMGQQTDDGGWTGSEALFFKHGTVTGSRKPTVNVDDGEGNITSMVLTIFEIDGDNNARQLFEFMANPGKTTNVEWSHVKIGTESSGRNLVGTTRGENFTAVNDYALQRGYTIREDNHSHVYSNYASKADVKQAERLNAKFPDAKSYNYFAPVGYTPYDAGTPPNVPLPSIQK